MKKYALLLLPVLLSGCSAASNEVLHAVKEPQDKIVLRVFDRKAEVAGKMKTLESLYEKEHPEIDLQFENLGGGVDYDEELYSKFALNDGPDIFSVEGYGNFQAWNDVALDITDKEWIKNAISGVTEGVSKDGRVYGTPIALEAYGFLYNKELFKQAGIEKLPTTQKELEAAAEQLQSKGITPFSNGYAEWWVIGLHTFNAALASQPNPSEFIEKARKGEIDFTQDKVMLGWADLLSLTMKYSKNALTTDYNSQVTNFAEGKTAMMQQGNWTQLNISQINPNLQVGVLPMPVDNENRDYIFTGVPNYWLINKESKHKEEAEKLINWLLSSEVGKDFLVKELKYIPAFKNIAYKTEDLGSIASSVQDYAKDGKTRGWYWQLLPDGATAEITKSAQQFMLGKISKEQMLSEIQKTIVNKSVKR
ncbi:ABC transporter substrate-binding protein [Paenibacillus caseinilyticus]|uniref:ABC transporter substrate-binding protein n=1 Tax=Paenibacillus caseinilyticus TaxID=3098138 RepID=UPI0022B907B8|nr:extracellular solute-binding protein [Paenibacillus caseinilyticus]MCZ8518292.1 extracellular solute-binding protein [Paenibacillus caseinilyticus]